MRRAVPTISNVCFAFPTSSLLTEEFFPVATAATG